MELHEVRPHIQAVIPPQGSKISTFGCNIGILHTDAGVVLIDTSVSIKRLELNLEQAGVQPQDVCLVIMTHVHADHTKGIVLFSCPVLCQAKAKGYLRIKVSKKGNEIISFSDSLEKDVGGVQLKIMHVGGHTPESLAVWLPEEKVLFSGDNIFSGTAPYMAPNTNFNEVVGALRNFHSLGAEVIVPGHGPLCSQREVERQIDYLENTWKVIEGHVQQGNPLGLIRKDINLPIMPGRNYERNIEWMYKKQTQKEQ